VKSKRKKEDIALHDLITKRCLALFLKEMVAEEMDHEGWVRSVECRRLLKSHVNPLCSEGSVKSLVARLVSDGYLKVYNGGTGLVISGYYTTSLASEFMQNQNTYCLPVSSNTLPIREIKKLISGKAKGVEKKLPNIPQRQKETAVKLDVQPCQKYEVDPYIVALTLAKEKVDAIEVELHRVRQQIEANKVHLSARQASNRATPPLILLKIQGQIKILATREAEEVHRLNGATAALETLVKEMESKKCRQ
jgi:hypothetical protein